MYDERYMNLLEDMNKLARKFADLAAETEDETYLVCSCSLLMSLQDNAVSYIKDHTEDETIQELEFYRGMPVLKILSELECENRKLCKELGKKPTEVEWPKFKTNGIEGMKNKVTCSTSSSDFFEDTKIEGTPV